MLTMNDENADPSRRSDQLVRDEQESVSLPLGGRLKKAREGLGLSLEDVASQLKIGARKIAALEQENWTQLPEAPYLRGFIRNYAKILKLDTVALIDEIDLRLGRVERPNDFTLEPSLRTPFPQRSRGSHDSGISRFMRLATILLVIVAGLIAWSGTPSFQRNEALMTSWLQDRTGSHKPVVPPAAGRQPSDATGAPGTPEAETAASQAATDPPGRPTTPGAPEPAVNAVPLTLAAVTSIVPPSDRDAGADSASLAGALVMRFNDDSWVEVRQADGKILMSQLNHAGAGKALDGAPPLELVIGNAPAVALQYRGSAVDLAPFTRDRVARLTLK